MAQIEDPGKPQREALLTELRQQPKKVQSLILKVLDLPEKDQRIVRGKLVVGQSADQVPATASDSQQAAAATFPSIPNR